eukprot:CAMPEP_0114263782 /NCGR_PEP_ID=MMETSP0058-20121206/22759_1 /TAXON_ID=36894 /ORGANISM="Pyramimonas parkeae, CCMP726" /LENGTH=115 /DNA_ID=CAMNT_0001380217 /DNA_START=1057 /DNA_END=1401 /DNA_ORIENTATION=+
MRIGELSDDDDENVNEDENEDRRRLCAVRIRWSPATSLLFTASHPVPHLPVGVVDREARNRPIETSEPKELLRVPCIPGAGSDMCDGSKVAHWGLKSRADVEQCFSSNAPGGTPP